MEFRRGYFGSLRKLVSILADPSVKTVSEAIQIASHEFSAYKKAAFLSFISKYLTKYRIDDGQPGSKKKFLRRLGASLNLTNIKLSIHYKEVGVNKTGCARAKVVFNIEASDTARSLSSFFSVFEAPENRSRCHIEKLLRRSAKTESEVIAELSISGKTKSVRDLGDRLLHVLAKADEDISCNDCRSIGDVVIALEGPRRMPILHTDDSFNHLCPPISQLNHPLRHETSVLTKGGSPVKTPVRRTKP